MLWVSLRMGWGNTGFVAALLMLPLVSLASPQVSINRAPAAIAAAQVDTISLAQAPAIERSSD